MKISVIIPVFNSGKTLKKCLNSVLNQTYSDWEIISINDGSSDNSFEILKEYSLIDNRIRVYSQDNHGPGYTRNRAISYASGDYIVFLDSDDYIEKDYFEDLNNIISECHPDVIFIDIIQEKPDGTIIRFEKMSKYKNSSKDTILRHQMTGKLPWGGYRKAVKRSLLSENNIRYTDNTVGEEALFSFRLISQASSISFLDKVYYHYVNYENSQSKKGDEDPWGPVCKEIKKFLDDNKLFNKYETTYNSLGYTSLWVMLYRKALNHNYRIIELKKALENYKKSFGFNVDKDSLSLSIRSLLPFVKYNVFPIIIIALKLKMLMKRRL